MEGRQVGLPVFLARRPEEAPDRELLAFYECLLGVLRRENFLQGKWGLCERSGWPDNQSYMNLGAWCWQKEASRCLIVVNLSDMHSQGLVRAAWEDLRGRSWQLKDIFTTTIYEWDGDEMDGPGIYVGLPPWEFHFLTCSQAP